MVTRGAMDAPRKKPAIYPGRVIDSRVRLVQELGAGSMGSVWRAHHMALGTDVAIKFIDSAKRNQAALVARFKREAHAAAKIKSPHVVRTFDHGVVQGIPYIVMELLEGESLGTMLDRDALLRPKLVGRIVAQTAKALHEAHELGIIHRDIKPDNIFLTRSAGEIYVKLLDFGLAKARESMGVLTQRGMAVGTPAYMSREQLLNSREAQPSADLWSLSVVAYECLTGELPFLGETMQDTCREVLRGEVMPPSEVNRYLNDKADKWFARALAKKVEDRFPSARALATSFLRLSRSLGEHEPQSGDSWESHAEFAPNSSQRPGPVVAPVAVSTKPTQAWHRKDVQPSGTIKIDSAKLAEEIELEVEPKPRAAASAKKRMPPRTMKMNAEEVARHLAAEAAMLLDTSGGSAELDAEGIYWDDSEPLAEPPPAPRVRIVPPAPRGLPQLAVGWDASTEVETPSFEPDEDPSAVRNTIVGRRQRGALVGSLVVGLFALLLVAVIVAIASL